MIYRRGDLALVPFPFTDLSSAKRRPVLVLADPDGYGDFVAVAVTSRPHHCNAIRSSSMQTAPVALMRASQRARRLAEQTGTRFVVRPAASLLNDGLHSTNAAEPESACSTSLQFR